MRLHVRRTYYRRQRHRLDSCVWMDGQPGTYGILVGAVVFQHKSSANASQPSEFYNYTGWMTTSTLHPTKGPTAPSSIDHSDGQ
ncbi:hypothetical protein GQ600_7683 [Phytophthora cactorum]|nr:hypothetical protein GQ600_7683 [Phytophthora cactorum]